MQAIQNCGSIILNYTQNNAKSIVCAVAFGIIFGTLAVILGLPTVFIGLFVVSGFVIGAAINYAFAFANIETEPAPGVN